MAGVLIRPIAVNCSTRCRFGGTRIYCVPGLLQQFTEDGIQLFFRVVVYRKGAPFFSIRREVPNWTANAPGVLQSGFKPFFSFAGATRLFYQGICLAYVQILLHPEAVLSS
jgi:hypothetical protein